MPELPEVETFMKTLRNPPLGQPGIIGRTIASADLSWRKTLARPEPEDFVRRISGQSVVDLFRRGKFLLLQLSQDWLLIHLRMSGDLFMQPSDRVDFPKHARLALHFENGWSLVFNDPRKFGRVWLVKNPAEVVGDLGVEPLNDQLTGESFFRLVSRKNRQLKPLLLDQTFIAGIGNIYSDEALHLARLHPLRIASSLNPDEATRLLNAIRTVLSEGILRNGSSIDWVYRGGDFQNHFRVYGQTGKPCPVCQTTIVHLQVGQRSTHICPQCQKLEE
jgi:formamidopyrimidine-DNA glycosylase